MGADRWSGGQRQRQAGRTLFGDFVQGGPCLAATVRLASSDLDAGNAGRDPGTANGGSHSSGHDEPSAGAGPGSPGAAPADGALPLVASGESQPAGGHRSVAGVVAASAPGGV